MRSSRRFWSVTVLLASFATNACTFIPSAAGAEAADGPPVSLNVAIFAWLPDAASAIERLEDEFEAKHGNIDVDFDLWDPYRDPANRDGTDQMPAFDVVEIDLCRFRELQSRLEPLPAEAVPKPEAFVEPARTALAGDIAKFAVPHWVCANFLLVRPENQKLVNATNLEELVAALDADAGQPLFGDFFGSTGLGELYADAAMDVLGPPDAQAHLAALSRVKPGEKLPLNETAVKAVLALAKEVPPEYRSNFEYFHDHTYVYPRAFASRPAAALLGYSERLYYVEREMQLAPGKFPPNIPEGGLIVRAIPFADRSQGTPSWVDAFVIPKGKLQPKRDAILKFLAFVQSDEGYAPFVEPTPYMAPSYLLPAVTSAYDGEILEKQPMLKAFRDRLDATMPVTDAQVFRGMRRAGEELEKMVSAP